MTHTARHLLALAALLGAAGAGARAQGPDLLPPFGRPATLRASNPGPVLSLPPPVVLPALQCPSPDFGPVVPSPAWLPHDYTVSPQTDPLGCAFRERDPRLEDPRWTPYGWFLDVETALVGTHVYNRIVSILQVGPAQFDNVHVPGAGLDWTVMPRFEVGYRLPHGLGEFLVSYQFLTTQGATDILNSQGVSHQTSRLNWNAFDFDYANRQFQFLPEVEMRWHVGVKLASTFFDARADQPGATDPFTGGAIEQRTSNYFIGAGPHVAGEIERRLCVPGLTLYSRLDFAWLWVHLHQHFEETLAGTAGFPPGVAAADTRINQGVANFGLQAGVHWSPPAYPFAHFYGGYLFQAWQQVGRNDNNGSNADVLQHGIFIRGEINF
jgi:hypothetical protein